MDLKRLDEEILKTLRNYTSQYKHELISEASKIKILTDKEGLDVEQSTYLDKQCGPLAVWMFKKIKEDYKKNIKEKGYSRSIDNNGPKKAAGTINIINKNNFHGGNINNVDLISNRIKINKTKK
jgi:hypothetical protein